MAGIKRHVVLYQDSAAGTGRWYRLDSKYEEAGTRGISIDNPGLDTISIEGTTKNVIGGVNPDGSAFDPETDILPADIVTLNTYAAAETGDVINSSWSWIRVVKVGTNGTATVEAML